MRSASAFLNVRPRVRVDGTTDTQCPSLSGTYPRDPSEVSRHLHTFVTNVRTSGWPGRSPIRRWCRQPWCATPGFAPPRRCLASFATRSASRSDGNDDDAKPGSRPRGHRQWLDIVGSTGKAEYVDSMARTRPHQTAVCAVRSAPLPDASRLEMSRYVCIGSLPFTSIGPRGSQTNSSFSSS